MFWHRNQVFWNERPDLYGTQLETNSITNFKEQKGIYILYDGPNILYVGQAIEERLERNYLVILMIILKEDGIAFRGSVFMSQILKVQYLRFRNQIEKFQFKILLKLCKFYSSKHLSQSRIEILEHYYQA
jgi:hypothetical protein